jgi:hypothetical protein
VIRCSARRWTRFSSRREPSRDIYGRRSADDGSWNAPGDRRPPFAPLIRKRTRNATQHPEVALLGRGRIFVAVSSIAVSIACTTSGKATSRERDRLRQGHRRSRGDAAQAIEQIV